MRARGLRRLSLALLLAGALAPATAHADSSDGLCLAPDSVFDANAEKTILGLVNDLRWAYGRRELRPRAWITQAARSHSADMAQGGYFGHSISGGRFAWAPRNRWAGENIALGGSPDGVVSMLMASAPHRATLMGRVFRNTGVGVVRTCTGDLLVTQGFVG